jgi:type II secretory pathway component GspD/PulD (secretin)
MYNRKFKMFKKTIISTIIASILGLSGCTGLSIPQDTEFREKELLQPAVDKFESAEPALIKRKTKPIKVIQPTDIPQEILNKKIELSLSGEAKIADLPNLLEEFGIYLVATENVDLDKIIYLNNFKGTVEDLFQVIGSINNLSFNYQRNNIISIDLTSDYVIDIPQNADIVAEMETAITPLGAQDIQSSIVGGTIMYKATYLDNQKIEKYVTRFSKNASVIGLQVAVMTVQLDKDSEKGFDWSKLNASIGNANILKSDTSSTTTGATGGTTGDVPSGTSGGAAGATDAAGNLIPTAEDLLKGSYYGSSLKNLQTLGNFTGTASTLRALNGTFDITAVINYLSTYGQTKTNQSVLMKTLSGKEVSLKSVQTIPYISGINNTSGYGGGSTGGNSGYGGGVSSGTETDEIEIGLTLDMTPYYDSDSGIVTVELELELSSLIAFLELSAGNQIGKLTQPQTQEQNFTNFMKLKAGESSIIGGVTYEQVADNRNSISYLETSKIASQNQKTSKNAVFIMLRPTVTMFGDFDKEIEIIQ